jgi:uncharacterized protein (TIGR02246 family)
MKRRLGALAVFLVLGAASFAIAAPKDEVAAATQAWAEAFNSRNPERVLALYDSEAVLWGTISPTLRDTPDAIRDYFKGLPGQPQGRVTIGEHRIRVYGDTAIDTGYYTFSNVRDGQPVTNPARFSLTYRRRDGRWLIVDHHSSAVPAAPRP